VTCVGATRTARPRATTMGSDRRGTLGCTSGPRESEPVPGGWAIHSTLANCGRIADSPSTETCAVAPVPRASTAVLRGGGAMRGT
jgi:hypothetical protein